MTLVLFDHEYDVIYYNLDLSEIPDLNDQSYQPRGTTALHDAIGRSIDEAGTRLSETKENERPEKVIVAILTDGYENAR